MRKLILLCLLIISGLTRAADAPDQAIHDELRAVMAGLTQAVNTKHFEQLAPYFHEKMRVTTITQEFIDSRAGIEPYFKRWFDQGGFLKNLDMRLEADAETELYDDKRFGIVRGKGIERYELADGRKFDMQTRWTATVIKDVDGKWRILALHLGTNFMDNPVVGAIERSVIWAGAGGLIVGLLTSLLGCWLVLRRRTAKVA